MTSEVLDELLDAVRRFVDKRLIPLEAQVDVAWLVSSQPHRTALSGATPRAACSCT